MIEYEDIARQMVRHENDLMNQRLTWLLTLEGLLFTALGFAWGKNDTGTRGLIYVFCGIGIAVPILTWFILDAAQQALIRLRAWWLAQELKDYNGPGIIGYWHEPAIIAWFVPWRVLPIIFVLAWIFVGYFNSSRPVLGSQTANDEVKLLQKTSTLSKSEMKQVRFSASFARNYPAGVIEYALYNPCRDKVVCGIVINVHATGLNGTDEEGIDLLISMDCGPLQSINNQQMFAVVANLVRPTTAITLKEVHYL